MYSCAEYDKKSVEQILPTQVLLPFSNVTFVFGKVVEAKKKQQVVKQNMGLS
jgi:hypothetical protein